MVSKKKCFFAYGSGSQVAFVKEGIKSSNSMMNKIRKIAAATTFLGCAFQAAVSGY
jgi:hypothetical protein